MANSSLKAVILLTSATTLMAMEPETDDNIIWETVLGALLVKKFQ